MGNKQSSLAINSSVTNAFVKVIHQAVICLLLMIMTMKASISSSAQTDQLPACPTTPNCVSSQATDNRHLVAPLSYSGDIENAWQVLISTLTSFPRVNIIEQSSHYLHVEVTSLVFRFVDDVEFMLDTTKNEIHVRSASRIGHSDFGVNRRRVESIRKRFLKNLDKLARE